MRWSSSRSGTCRQSWSMACSSAQLQYGWVTDQISKAGEIGYTLNRNYWGRGYATEVAVLLLQLGFENLGLERISATCDARNTASIRVLEKAGLTLQARRGEDLENCSQRAETLIFHIVETRA
ncbi:GNAT family N-acetyltransferase [Glutamicibacter arilaitensis]|uniref:GNAT family N-acetyltransferase n=2 Tax=Glutamicibacter arilaitensis TaxID=256701 RepID=UPI003FD1A0EF